MQTSSEINIAEVIMQTINTLISNIFSSIDNSLYSVLDDLVFIDTDIMNSPYLKTLLGEDGSNRNCCCC